MKKRTLNRKTTHVSGDTELGRSWGYVRVTPQKSNENIPISNEANLWTGKKPNRVIEVNSPSEFLPRNPITPVNRTPYVNERVIAVSSSKKKTNVEITSTIFTSRSGEFSKKRDTVSLELNEASTPSVQETDIPEPISTPGISLPSDSTTRISDFTLRLKKSLLNGRTGTENFPLSKHIKGIKSFTKQYSSEREPEHERRVEEIRSETSFSDMLPLPTGEKYSMINVILRKLRNQSVKSEVISKQGSVTSIDIPSNFHHHPDKPSTIDRNVTFEERPSDSTISHDISLEAVDGLVDLNSPLDDSDCVYDELMSPKEVLVQTVETQTDIDNRTHSPTDKDVQTSIVKLQSQTTQTDTIQDTSPCSDTENNSPTLTLSQIESPLNHEQEFSTISSPTNEFSYMKEPHVSALFEDSDIDTQHTIHPIFTHEDLAVAIQHQLKSHVKEAPFYETLINDALPYAILNKNANQLTKSKKTFDEALNQFLDEHVIRASPVMSPSVPPVALAPAPTFVKDNDFSSSYSYASYDGLDYSYVSKEAIIDQLNQIKLNSEADDFKIRRKALEDLRALTIIVVGSEYEDLLREELEFNQNEDVQHIIMEVFQLFQSCT
ncbi:hypothetical protein K7432_000563 [Basidiobolus ranarum]|uniref:DUF4378 domain-containing protein n=1 Tax=Basidiobolus ranarum TaxID=34480 RepID=A0ABR2X4I0_9FUNG